MERESRERCINKLLECGKVCNETVPHCLSKGGAHNEAGHISMLDCCAQMCGTAAIFMERGSELSGKVCNVAAEVCQACSKDCARMCDDAEMERCKRTCDECSQECSRMT